MSRYRKLTTACLAAALALGLAACGGGGSSTPPATTGDDTKKGTSMAPAPGSCTDAACVKLYADALTAAQNELAALLADPKSTQAQITAARNAVTAAQTALSTAQTALATYNAMQPPTFNLAAMNTAVKTPSTLPDGLSASVDGGEVSATGYSAAAWPAPTISGWDGSVWENENETAKTMDTVVVYTNKEDNKSVDYSTYYRKGATSDVHLTDTDNANYSKPASGFSWNSWAGVASVSDDTKGILTLANLSTDAAVSRLIDAAEFPGKGGSRTYEDEDSETTGVQVELAGKFHGVSGMFKCTGDSCIASRTSAGIAYTGTWTFVPDSTRASVIAQTDADYLDFGYWLKTDNSGDTPTYSANAIIRGKAPTADLALEGSATYTGAAAGLYAKREYSNDPTEDGDVTAAGRFTASARLKAYFGGGLIGTDLQNTISGTISNFMDGDNPIDASWMVNLNKTNINSVGTTANGTTTGAGAWNALFFGTAAIDGNLNKAGNQSTLPPHIAGRFDAKFSNGAVVGSFGATKQ